MVPNYEKRLNRRNKTAPKVAGRFWCGCDRAKVYVNEKCPVCGYKYKTKHQKPSNA